MSASEGGSPSLGSESGPPPAQPATISADALRASHPLWQRAAGRPAPNTPARTGARGRDGSQNGERPRFEPLSALALELETFRNNADGDSALFSETDSLVQPSKKKQRRATRDEGSEDEEGDEQGFSVLGSEEDDDNGYEEGHRESKSKSKKASRSGRAPDAAMLASAAFGGGYAHGSDDDDDGSSAISGTSSQRKKQAYKAAFPIKGVDCVGCALVKKIVPVETFILENMEKMADEALWKMAALTYVREVQEPRKREGVITPNWAWKDLRTHFLLHCCNPRIARVATCRQLQTMRYAVEQRLMRVDGEEKEVDKAGCDLMLKIVKAESDQRALLAATSGNSSGGSKKQPGGSTVGDAK